MLDPVDDHICYLQKFVNSTYITDENRQQYIADHKPSKLGIPVEYVCVSLDGPDPNLKPLEQKLARMYLYRNGDLQPGDQYNILSSFDDPSSRGAKYYHLITILVNDEKVLYMERFRHLYM